MTSSLSPPPTSSLFINEAHERHQSLLRERERVLLDDETLKLLSKYISMQNIPEDRHIFSIKWCQVHTRVKKYGKMIGVDITPIRSGTTLPSTGCDRIRISGDCSCYWGTAV